MGKRKMGVTVRALMFSLPRRGHRQMQEPSDVGFFPGRSSGPTCPLGGRSALLGRSGRWQRTLTPGIGLSKEELGELPRVLLNPAAWGAQLGLGKQEAVLRGAPGWVMGVFPTSGTKGQKLIMKHAVLIVDKRGSRHSGARRFPKGLEHLLASLRPPSGAAISHAESRNQCAKK